MSSRSRSLLVFAIAAALAAGVALAGCAGQSGSSASADSSASSVSASSSDASSSAQASSGSSEPVPVIDNANVVTIALDYNAGTGYEWRCTSIDPEGIMQLTGQDTDDLAQGQNVDGGPLQDRFEFQAVQPGEVVLTFELKRFWEEGEDAAETQVYAFTVGEDLQMVLNPYKSDFQNEPIWGAVE